jgi:hypothetical protein
MSRAASTFVLLVVAITAIGCGDATEVLVVTDSDMSIPAEIDSLETVVVSPEGTMQRSAADLSAQGFPRTLSLVHEGNGALGPFDVSVSGRLGGSVVVSRQAAFTFVEGERRVLVMHLVGSCRTNSCSGAQTCTENGCQSINADLQEWTGSPPTLGGSGPVDSGTPMPDASPDTGGDMCGAGETNCGGSCVDTSSDVNHCGRCNNGCRGRETCVDGFCE